MMTLAVQIVAILFMLTMMFLGIWGFIIANKAYNQVKYQNYLLEKIAQNISLRNKDKIVSNDQLNEGITFNENNINDLGNIIEE